MATINDKLNVIVISKPGVPHLRVLDELPPSAHLVIGDTLESLAAALPTADAMLNANFGSEPFRTVFPKAPKLRWVHSLSAGVEAVLSPEMLASDVTLTNARGVFKVSLAEFCIAAMLHFAKDLRRMVRNQMAGRWEQFDVEVLEGATFGIVGYGEIGRAAARLAEAFGMRVLAVRRRTAQADSLVTTFAPDQLHEMLAQCDYVALAAPNTPETKGMIDAAAIAHMKPSAVLINVGRGPVVDEAALIAALETGRIRGAALDVFNREPLPEGHPFYRLENVLLSPHCADHTVGWVELAMRKFVDNYKLFETGKTLDNIVDKSAGY